MEDLAGTASASAQLPKFRLGVRTERPDGAAISPNPGFTSEEKPAAGKEAYGARLRARSPCRGIAGRRGGGGRLDVRGFLRLADLLHQRVVESLEEEEQGGGGVEALVLAGYGEAGPGAAADGGGGEGGGRGGGGSGGSGGKGDGGRGSNRRRDSLFWWDVNGGEARSVDWGRDEEEEEEDGGDAGDGGGGGSAVAAPLRQGWVGQWCAALAGKSRSIARGVVGRVWFFRGSQVMAMTVGMVCVLAGRTFSSLLLLLFCRCPSPHPSVGPADGVA